MHKSLKFVSMLAFFVLISSAARAELEVGVLGGYRQNELTSNNATLNYKSTAGYQLGGLVHYSLGKLIGVRSGLIYATKGVEGTVPSLNLPVKTTVNYLDIPLDVFASLPATSLYAFGGLKYGLLVSSKIEIGTLNPDPNLKSSNLLLNLGAGYGFELANLTLAVELEYEQGIMNTSNNAGEDVRTKGLMANVVLFFGI